MRRFILIFLIVGTFVFASSDDINVLSKKADKFKGKFDKVILYDLADVHVKKTGMNLRVEETAIKVLSRRGCNQYHTVSLFYDPLTMEMKVAEAEVIRKDGTKVKVDLKNIKRYPQPARAIYWPNIRISIPFGLLEPGDIVRYKLDKKGFSYALLADEDGDSRYTPPMKGHFYDIVNFQEYSPVLHKRYAVEFPAGKPVQYRFYRGDVNSAAEFTDYGRKYIFEKRDIPAIKREPHMLGQDDTAYRLLISTTRKWEDKSEWFYKVNENYSFNVTEEVRKKVKELIAKCKTDEEKVDVLNHWVAHYIRYSGISMGKGEGFTLHSSEMIMRDRTGVCKDKASLLVTFLRAAGFDAYPAMTMAGAKIENFPADHFNHCVVALREKDGSFTMLDPTWIPWVREQWSSAEQEQQYLVGYKKGQTLMTTPYSPPEKHFYNLDVNCRLDRNGKLTGTFSVECEGQTDSRLRRYLRRNHKVEGTAYLINLVKSSWPQAKITSLSYHNPEDLSKRMTVNIRVEIPGYALKDGKKLYFKSPALWYTKADRINRDLGMRIKGKDRTWGIRSGCTKMYRIKEAIRFDGKLISTKADTLKKKSHKGKFADITVKSNLSGKYLKTDLVMKLKKRIYPKEAFKDLKEVLSSFNDAEGKILSVEL